MTNPATLDADLFFPAAYALAESAMWSAASGELIHVDIDMGDIHRLDAAHPLVTRTTHVGGWLSAVVPAGPCQVIAMSQRGLLSVDLITGLSDTLLPPDAIPPGYRYNDAKLDRQGRLIVSTMRITAPRTPTGTIYHYDGKGLRPLIDGVTTPNALSFSPDGLWLYACDTGPGTIWRYPYDPATGAIGERSDLAAVDIAPGKPDGATVDAEGCIWSARYNGGVVARITPEGKLDRLIRLPVQQITSCAFGGPKLDTLFITTARQNLDADRLAAQPLAGSVFAVRPGVTGLAETPFVGRGATVASTKNNKNSGPTG